MDVAGKRIVITYPSATDTPMMTTSQAGPEPGFNKEPASAVAAAIVAGIEAGAMEVVRGGDARTAMVALNRENPAALDERFLGLKPALEAAVRNHAAL